MMVSADADHASVTIQGCYALAMRGKADRIDLWQRMRFILSVYGTQVRHALVHMQKCSDTGPVHIQASAAL